MRNDTPARDREITTRGLEDAFLALTGDGADAAATSTGTTSTGGQR